MVEQSSKLGLVLVIDLDEGRHVEFIVGLEFTYLVDRLGLG